MTNPRPSLFEIAAAMARAEAATLPRAIERADRVKYVAQLRHAYLEPVSSEGERVRACRDAGVDPYGEL
jgi:hypothetical protein